MSDSSSCQIKVTLKGVKPPIWRRLLVPGALSLKELHHVLQSAFGWEDDHLHQFSARGRRLPERFRLDEILTRAKEAITYEYDFGDGWEHEVTLEGIFPRRPRGKYPVCLGGDLSCPPEDCGGVSGYYDCIDVLINLDNSEGKLDWLGDWRPDAFDPNKVRFWSPLRRLKVS